MLQRGAVMLWGHTVTFASSDGADIAPAVRGCVSCRGLGFFLCAESKAMQWTGSRIAVVSDPGRGKSSLIQNQVCRSAPWAAVYVIHGMADSHEYDLIEHTKLTFEEATPEFFAAESQKHNKQPCAIIVDDSGFVPQLVSQTAL